MSKKSREQKRRRKGAASDAAGASCEAPPPRPPLSKAAKRRAQKKRAKLLNTPKPAGTRARPVCSPAIGDGSLRVIHEDEHVIAIDKPAGMVCHPCHGFWEAGSVIHGLSTRQRLAGFTPIDSAMLCARQRPTGEQDSFIPRAIVHRLDRGTTGVLLLAKTVEAEVCAICHAIACLPHLSLNSAHAISAGTSRSRIQGARHIQTLRRSIVGPANAERGEPRQSRASWVSTRGRTHRLRSGATQCSAGWGHPPRRQGSTKRYPLAWILRKELAVSGFCRPSDGKDSSDSSSLRSLASPHRE